MLSLSHVGGLADLWLWHCATQNQLPVILMNAKYGQSGCPLAGSISVVGGSAREKRRRKQASAYVILETQRQHFSLVRRNDGQHVFDRATVQRSLPNLWLEHSMQNALDDKERILWRAVTAFALMREQKMLPGAQLVEKVAGTLWGGGHAPSVLFEHVPLLSRFECINAEQRKALFEALMLHGAAQSCSTAYNCPSENNRLEVRLPDGNFSDFCVTAAPYPVGDDLSNDGKGNVWLLRRANVDKTKWWVLKFVEAHEQVELHRLLRADDQSRAFLVPLVFDFCVQARLWTSANVCGQWKSAKVSAFVCSGPRKRSAPLLADEQRKKEHRGMQNAQIAVFQAMSRICESRAMTNINLRDADWCSKQNCIRANSRVLFHDFDRSVQVSNN